MKIFLAGVHDGSNTNALMKYCIHHRLGDECYTFGYEDFDVVLTTNGRLVKDVPGRLKINCCHGNLFLGDTQPEPQYGIDVTLTASESEKAMMVRNGYQQETVWITGQPRMDLLHAAVRDSTTRAKYLESVGLDISKPTVLYAPTYSRKAFGGGHKLFFASSRDHYADIDMMKTILKSCWLWNCSLIIRLHKYIKRDHNGKLFPDYMQEAFDCWPEVKCEMHDNEMYPNSIPVLAASDILITDFSSITADFLALDREIVFIEPQLEWKYTNQWHALPEERHDMGAVCERHDELRDHLDSLLSGNRSTFAPRRQAMQSKYQPLFDGLCCERVFNAIEERVNG